MASSKGFVRVMFVLAMMVLLATPSSASFFGCFRECKSACEALETGKIKCILTCIPTCLVTGGGGGATANANANASLLDGAAHTNSDCKRSCFNSECINFVDDEKKAIGCMKSCDYSCEKKI